MNRYLLAIGVTLAIAGGTYQVLAGDPAITCADLSDAGYPSDCSPRLVTCPVHLSEQLAAVLTDAGAPLPRAEQRYAWATTAALVWDGGAFIPLLYPLGVRDSTGVALEVVRTDACRWSACDGLCAAPLPLRWETTLPCVRAPLDGGQDCQRFDPMLDAGRFFGTGNVFPTAEALGAGCEPVAVGCGEVGVVAGQEGGL